MKWHPTRVRLTLLDLLAVARTHSRRTMATRPSSGDPSFESLGVKQSLQRALIGLGIAQPTQIQAMAMPPLLRGESMFLSAETGTGKTVAYAAPALYRVFQALQQQAAVPSGTVPGGVHPGPLCLVLTPTTDLATQVHRDMSELARHLAGVNVDLVTAGGQAGAQARGIERRAASVVVATPGRLLRLLQQGTLEEQHPQGPMDDWSGEDESEPSDTTHRHKNAPAVRRGLRPEFLQRVQIWILDECDRMARMGLLEDVKKLFPYLPKPRPGLNGGRMQVVLVSATVVPEAEFILRRFSPRGSAVNLNPDLQVAAPVKHVAYLVSSRRKHALLAYLLRRRASLKGHRVLVFVRTTKRAEQLCQLLIEDGFKAACVHGDRSPAARHKIVEAFRAEDGSVQCCVSTDVLGRGIHIPNLPFVVNYDMPEVAEEYVHRVGRTGRAGVAGMAISLVNKLPTEVRTGYGMRVLDEREDLEKVEKLLGRGVEMRKVPGPWKDSSLDGKEEGMDGEEGGRTRKEPKGDRGVGVGEAGMLGREMGGGRRPGIKESVSRIEGRGRKVGVQGKDSQVRRRRNQFRGSENSVIRGSVRKTRGPSRPYD